MSLSRAERTRTNLPGSMVLPPPLARELLGRAPAHHLVQQSLLVPLLAQQPAQPLHVLPDAAGAGQDDAHVGRGYVHAFVEYLAGDDHRVLARVEAPQDLLP